MTLNVAKILKKIDQLSVSEKEELAEYLAGCLGSEIPPSFKPTHLDTLRRRITEVESGQVSLIAGPTALAQVKQAISQGVS